MPVAPATGCPIVSIQETLVGVPVGATVNQAVTAVGIGGTIAAVGAFPAAVNGVVVAGTTTAGSVLPVGTTKTCSTAVPAPGATFTCTVIVPAGVASPVAVAVANATVTTATVAPAVGVVTGAAGTNAFTVTCNTTVGGAIPVAAGTACPSGFTITETLVAGAGLGTAITETLSAGGPGFPAVALTATNAPITITAAGAAFITSITLAGCVQAATIAAPTATSFLGGATVITTINPGQQVTCRLDLNDTEAGALGALVSSGIVEVTVSGLANNGVIASIAAAGPGGAGTPNVTGNTATIRCGAPNTGANTVNGCDFVDVTFTANQTAVVGALPATIGVNATYKPDIPAQNTSAQFNGTLFTIVIGVAGFVQPTGIAISCPTALNANLATGATGTLLSNLGAGLPGPIGNLTVAGVGVLPSALICQAVPTVNGVPTAVAPGTIEISSVNGTLLDASGNITTNLRIGCNDQGPTVTTFGVGVVTGLNFNTCVGVNFGVLGLGVGFVELRARYEPSSVSAAAGIREVEGTGSVGFVAPPIIPVLTLTPPTVTASQSGATVDAAGNVVGGAPCTIAAPGATAAAATSCGTATVSFLGSLVSVNGEIFVNPTTGAFIRNVAGSVLNGNVIFTSSDTNIARFVTPNGGTGPSFTTIGNQAVVRCGNQLNAGTGFANFFGGCAQASAVYQGVNPGQANISATFIPDLPGAFGTFGNNVSGFSGTAIAGGANAISANVFPLLSAAGNAFNAAGMNVTSTATLTVTGPTAATTQVLQLVRGCNNVSPTVTESASAYAARVSAASALVSIFEYQPATNSFRGFSPLPGAPSDLATVTRLRPVFVCVNAAATLTQPAI